MHLAAESHVDRSIENPKILLQAILLVHIIYLRHRLHYKTPSHDRKNNFKFHHISTDEVFGTLGKTGKFNEESQYKPRSPYSASKASSDHLVNSWLHTYGFLP